ncbi:MAG: GIY-YIG nuclease family protein [Proteobacteria bacterium]|nr:GIY-YIG nuclease family protein [Pseudomonadota bacterium]MDA1064359.1 GIY-YIG nuclease family protein [Pseudomonadota bacterium]
MLEPQVRYSLYILRCADGSLYTGIALDVGKRLQEHELSPRGAKYLRGRGPLTLEFQAPVGDRRAASRAEYLVKSLPKSDKERLITGATTLVELGADRSRTQVSGSAGG